MRKPLIIANWKMNPKTLREALVLAQEVKRGVARTRAEVVLCSPFVFIPQLTASKNVKIGAQDCFWEQQGAFTGEVSPAMLKAAGGTFVILGHSERKKYLGETEEQVAKKVNAALKAGLKVVLCVKDSLELQRLKKLGRLSFSKNMFITYEPPSAISTEQGKRVDPSGIGKEAEKIRKIAGPNVPVLYGGSVEAKSVRAIMNKGGVQGVLVGAASLKSKEFSTLLKQAVLGYTG